MLNRESYQFVVQPQEDGSAIVYCTAAATAGLSIDIPVYQTDPTGAIEQTKKMLARQMNHKLYGDVAEALELARREIQHAHGAQTVVGEQFDRLLALVDG